MKNRNQRQIERLSFIDFSANFLGQIGRNDIVKRFGISDAAASKALADYIEKEPLNLAYDFKVKKHYPTKKFKPAYRFPVTQVLRALSTGFGDTLEKEKEPFITTVSDPVLNKPSIEILVQVSRAINMKKIIKVKYGSLSSGFTERLWAPFAIVDSGLRWHLRAFDRNRNEFRDFVLTRIKSAVILANDKVLENETPECDDEWNRIVTLKIVPHPNISDQEAIVMDYGMKDGFLEITSRAKVAPYVLRHWNIDCTEDHSLKGKHYQLWLSNRNEIEGIDDFFIAPGIN